MLNRIVWIAMVSALAVGCEPGGTGTTGNDGTDEPFLGGNGIPAGNDSAGDGDESGGSVLTGGGDIGDPIAGAGGGEATGGSETGADVGAETGNANDEKSGDETVGGGTTDVGVSGAVGSACASSSDCLDAGAACLDLPAGYCVVAGCATGGTQCPGDSLCFEFQGGDTYCLDTCVSDADCRQEDGYICDVDNTCWPGESSGGTTTGGGTAGGGTTTPGASAIGGPCEENSDCADAGALCYPEFYNGEHTGFVGGYCLINDCTPGSCPSGSTCEAIYANAGTACMASCASSPDCRNTEGYACFQPGMCFPGCGQGSTCPANYACEPDTQQCGPACSPDTCPSGLVCATNGLCEEPPCTPGSCGAGLVCASNGTCVADMGDGPGAGPGPACSNLPPKDCTGSAAYCGEILQFSPEEGTGYVNYPLNGETWSNQYRSYARRDMQMLIKWATAYVDCKSAGWSGGNGFPLGLGDMSEADGSIPGTSVGQPGHPPGTHEDGYDMDIAYYQNAGNDNYLKPVCDHIIGGSDQYHCTSEPYLLDLWKNALFLGALQSSERTRVIGVDGQVGSLVTDAISVLCANGWIPAAGCTPAAFALAFETTNTGAGWYMFHHHHLHLSLWGISSSSSGFVKDRRGQCIDKLCVDMTAATNALKDQRVPGSALVITPADLK